MGDQGENTQDNNENSEQYIPKTYFFESEMVGNRTDWFMIFHAILFEAYFSVHDFNASIIIDQLGILISCIWLVTGIRGWRVLWQLGHYMKEEEMVGKEIARKHDILFTDRQAINRKYYGWAKPVPVFFIIIPLLFLIAWVCVLKFSPIPWQWIFLSLGIMFIIFCLLNLITLIEYKLKADYEKKKAAEKKK